MNERQDKLCRRLHQLADDLPVPNLRSGLHALAEAVAQEFERQRQNIRGSFKRRLRQAREGAAREHATASQE